MNKLMEKYLDKIHGLIAKFYLEKETTEDKYQLFLNRLKMEIDRMR